MDIDLRFGLLLPNPGIQKSKPLTSPKFGPEVFIVALAEDIVFLILLDICLVYEVLDVARSKYLSPSFPPLTPTSVFVFLCVLDANVPACPCRSGSPNSDAV